MWSLRTLSIALLSFQTVQGGAQDLAVQLTGYDDACGNATGGAIAAITGGTPPYILVWSPEPPVGQGTASISGLVAGQYSLMVTDAAATEVTSNVIIGTTSGLLVPGGSGPAGNACGGQCNGTWFGGGFLGGQGPYTVEVTPSGPVGTATVNGITVNGLCPGTSYGFTVADVNGCSVSYSGINVVNGVPPSVLVQNVQPPCDASPTGSAQVIFNQNITAAQLVSGVATVAWQGNQLQLAGMPPGVVVVNVFGNSAFCPFMLQLDIPLSPDPCALLGGVLYADLEGNCLFDGNDVGMPYRMLSLQPGDRHLLTNEAGSFSAPLAYGAHTLALANSQVVPACLPEHPVPIEVSTAAPSAYIELPHADVPGADARVLLQTSAHRVGGIAIYTVIAQNNSGYIFTGFTAQLAYDLSLSFAGASVIPQLNEPGLLEWNVLSIQPFQTLVFQAYLQIPDDPGLAGTSFSATASVQMPFTDAVPSNDQYTLWSPVHAAHPGNDKRSITSSQLSEEVYYLNDDLFVDHTIRFQNAGPVEVLNVSIVDTIADLFDLLSLEIMGASHSFKAELFEGRVMQFNFNKIMLPDSATDPILSQGFISYRLRPVQGILPGDVLRNTAHIFMDGDPALVTNTTEIVVETSVGLTGMRPMVIMLHPNPVLDLLQVQLSPDGVHRIELYTMDGRLLREQSISGGLLSMRVYELAPGIYVLRAVAPDGTVGSARFVKQ